MDRSSRDAAPTVHQTLSGWSRKDSGRVSFELSHVEPGPSEPPERAPFVIDETPHVMWDHQLRKKNLTFLQGIDAGYFRHVAEVHNLHLDSGDKETRQRSAVALRLAHAHALETFCALLAASVQAPRFALGWLLRYQNRQLTSVIRKLSSGTPVHSAWAEPFSWLKMSELVHKVPRQDSDGALKDVVEAFAAAWSFFAADFVDQTSSDEYNSLKHGLRPRPGGFQISVGPLDQSGQVDPLNMTAPSGSPYGSSYFVSGRLALPRNWLLTEHHQNWVPENLIAAVALLSMSVNNLVWFLRRQGGDSAPAQFQRPSKSQIFGEPWQVKLEFDRMVTHSLVTDASAEGWTDAEILKLFPKK